MATESPFRLLETHQSFAAYFATQFLGALNDNIYKNALLILFAFGTVSVPGLNTHTIINASAGLFILPFFLFSAIAGQLADKYDKARLIRHIKLAEIIIMLGAAIGLYYQSGTLLIGILFLMGTQSAFFGPAKYSLLPQQLKREDLIAGNGLVEMGTFLAIILGTVIGGILIAFKPQASLLLSLAVVLIALIGYVQARRIAPLPPPNPDTRIRWNIFTHTVAMIRFAREKQSVFLAIIGISWFWFFGALFLSQLPQYVAQTLNANESVATLLLACYAIGIGVGSILCDKLCDRRVEIGIVPFGAIGLTLFTIDMGFAHSSHTGSTLTLLSFITHGHNWRVCLDLLLMGLFSGLYIVPLYAMVQQRSAPAHRAQIIAATNIINALFMMAASLWAIFLLNAGLTIPQLFTLTGVMTAIVSYYIFRLVPEFLMRFLAWLLVHSIYRVTKRQLSDIPDEGACIVACNHVSFVDPIILKAVSPRPLRFVVAKEIYDLPVVNFFCRTVKAIPIAPKSEHPTLKYAAYDAIIEALENGEAVAIFPEGGITRHPEIQPLRPGLAKIMQQCPVPVIPVALQGLWGSFFSRKYGKAMWHWPRKFIFHHIGVVTGAPIPPDAFSLTKLHEAMTALRGDWL